MDEGCDFILSQCLDTVETEIMVETWNIIVQRVSWLYF
jgi:hypothetical protein